MTLNFNLRGPWTMEKKPRSTNYGLFIVLGSLIAFCYIRGSPSHQRGYPSKIRAFWDFRLIIFVMVLPSVPAHDAGPQNNPHAGLNSPVNQDIEVLDVVLQQVSQIEHCRSDLRRFSPDDARTHTPSEEAKVTLTMSKLPGTSQINYTTEQNHTMSTARENAIASLIVLANIVPV